jgi:hypothetical protein
MRKSVITLAFLACSATVVALLAFTLSLSRCAGSIEVVGYGNRPDLQHGLKVELVSNGDGGALIQILNTSSNTVSVNQSPLAISVSLLNNGKSVKPSGHVMIKMDIRPRPNDFVTIAPGQTRNIHVPVSHVEEEFHTFTEIYSLKKGTLYDVEVQLNPYFGKFTKASAPQTLADFKIPNYLHEPLRMNSMTIRIQ